MAKRRFQLTFEVDAVIELDDQVIAAVDDNWRSFFYDLHTPENIAEMIANNMLRGADLSQLDGWADQPNSNAALQYAHWDCTEVFEVKPK